MGRGCRPRCSRGCQPRTVVAVSCAPASWPRPPHPLSATIPAAALLRAAGQNSARRWCRKCLFICGCSAGAPPAQSSVISAGPRIAMSVLRRIRGDDGLPDAGCVSGCVHRGGLSGRAGASRAAPDGSQPGSTAIRSSGYERYSRCTPPGECLSTSQRCWRRQRSAGSRLPLLGSSADTAETHHGGADDGGDLRRRPRVGGPAVLLKQMPGVVGVKAEDRHVRRS